MKKFILQPSPHPSRQLAMQAVSCAQDGYVVTIKEPTRSLDQNAALWPVLDALSKQVKWPVNGEMQSITPEDWKDILTAAYKKETRMALGIDGGMVLLGSRTSRMTKRDFSEFLEFVQSVATQKGIEL